MDVIVLLSVIQCRDGARNFVVKISSVFSQNQMQRLPSASWCGQKKTLLQQNPQFITRRAC